jgi:hypothetical protein
LLELVIAEPDVIDRLAAEPSPADVHHPLARMIYETCLALRQAGKVVDVDALLLHYDDLDGKSLLVQLDEEGSAKQQCDLTQRMNYFLRAVRERRAKVELERQFASFKNGTLPQEQEEQALSRFFQMKSRQAGSAPTEG